MRKIVSIVCVALSLGACTLTNSRGEAVVLTADTAPGLVLAKLQQVCQWKTTAEIATVAVQAALKASADTRAKVATIDDLVTIACTLLAPPPTPPMVVVTVDPTPLK